MNAFHLSIHPGRNAPGPHWAETMGDFHADRPGALESSGGPATWTHVERRQPAEQGVVEARGQSHQQQPSPNHSKDMGPSLLRTLISKPWTAQRALPAPCLLPAKEGSGPPIPAAGGQPALGTQPPSQGEPHVAVCLPPPGAPLTPGSDYGQKQRRTFRHRFLRPVWNMVPSRGT